VCGDFDGSIFFLGKKIFYFLPVFSALCFNDKLPKPLKIYVVFRFLKDVLLIHEKIPPVLVTSPFSIPVFLRFRYNSRFRSV